jgi:hypothetical protein
MVELWTAPDWRAEADAWIAQRLAERGIAIIGPLDQPHVRRWATVLRIPTDAGTVFFKANEPALSHEAAVVAFVSARHPDLVPTPLAVDLDRGWMLMEDAGRRLRELVEEERDLGRWLDLLPRYARLQIDLAGDADALVRLGLPDLRLGCLPEAFDALLVELREPGIAVETGLAPEELERLAGAAARVPAMCRELAAFDVPETIQHDDLNDGQVFVRDGVTRLLDWADACVSHPFFSLSVALEGVIQWGVDDVAGSVDTAPFRDAYLEPFAREWPRSDLREAVRIALRLGWACRAVNGRPPGGRLDAATGARLRMFLDGRA